MILAINAAGRSMIMLATISAAIPQGQDELSLDRYRHIMVIWQLRLKKPLLNPYLPSPPDQTIESHTTSLRCMIPPTFIICNALI